MRVQFAASLLIVAVSVSGAAIVTSPYLQGLTPGSVYVLVECTTMDSVSVRYGPTVSYGLFAAEEGIVPTTGGTYVHRILLQGLSANTTYHYSVQQAGTASADGYFTTGVRPGTPFRFAWMADCRTNSSVFDSVMTHIAAQHPLIGLFGGDLADDGTYASWEGEFFRQALRSFGADVPWVNTSGNHEGWSANTQAFTRAPAGSPAQDYFSFDCGDVHVLVLDSESSLVAGSAQYKFADIDLSASQRTWKIVMVHFPAYCSGGHGENADLIALTTAVFEKRGVDMLLAGHSHFYQHNLVRGIHHMVIGSAGAPLYDPTNASYTLKSVKQYNWAMCNVTPTSLGLFVFNENGTPLDTVLLSKPAASISLKPSGNPREPFLEQNYPNPFNPSTTIRYQTLSPGVVRLTVYDQLGREVARLVNGFEPAGSHSVAFNGAGLASGTYYYRLSAGDFTWQRMMALLK
jgi:acid phosphatase type 7